MSEAPDRTVGREQHLQSLPAIMPIKILYSACPVLPVLSCLASTPSECLYHVCVLVATCSPRIAHLSCSSNPRMILCHFLLGWTTGLPERRRAGTTANKHAASSIYSLYIHPTQQDGLGLLAPAHALPRSRSNDRQGREIVRYAAPHTSHLSAICRTLPSTRRCTMSTSLSSTREFVVAWRWLVPRGRHGGGSGSTGMQPIPR